jgi:hypothetical protein
MKIIKSSLKQTSFTCPSSWSGLSDDGSEIEIHFRLGRLELRSKSKVLAKGERDAFDVTSFMELEEALLILAKQGFESE